MFLYSLPVRELCEFAAKVGDLDHRFTPSPTAQEGIAGHLTVASRQGSARRNEVFVSGEYKHLRIRGRADGFYEADGLLEEVKTYRGSIDNIPGNRRALHVAQAKVYAALLCRKLNLSSLKVGVTYFEIARQEETNFVEECNAAELQTFFEALCERFLSWASQELEHRRVRNESLAALQFIHAAFRPGQRELSANVFHAARAGRHLMAQAPTGIGKTIGSLFPLLKACAASELDKVFFLTAKTSGQQTASEAIAAIRHAKPGAHLRSIEIVARDKACEHPGKACQGDSCPLARGFYDRLPAARAAAIATHSDLGRDAVRRVARDHAVCPYYLAQELVRWSDVVVADYNYFFDSTAMLHALTLSNEWKVAVVVDEAHNLLERARSMYSATLSSSALNSACELAPPSLQRPMQALRRCWSELAAEQPAPYVVLSEIPDDVTGALLQLTGAITEQLADDPASIGSELLRFYFDALHFNRMAESFGQHSLFDVTLVASGSVLSIRNVVPASFLKARYASTRTTVLTSATLSPRQFYADTLGLRHNTVWLDVESPFTSDQLAVHVVRNVSTRYRDRARSLQPIADLIAAQWARQPGNYLAFFSSFDYLERAKEAFETRYPHVPVWSQQRARDGSTGAEFLERFVVDGKGIGFAVLGGSFAEGVDLPGTRLIGAFIATLGLPQVNPVNEEIRLRHEHLFGAGHDYTYLFPGLRKVVQAAGRVIRSTTDVGTLYLVDDRFDRPEVRALLPTWWDMHSRSETPRNR